MRKVLLVVAAVVLLTSTVVRVAGAQTSERFGLGMFAYQNRTFVGVVVRYPTEPQQIGGFVVELPAAARAANITGIPGDLLSIMDQWNTVGPKIKQIVAKVAPIFPPKTAPPKDRFYTAFVTPGSLTLRAFGSPEGLKSVAAMNAPDGRRASLPGFGGIGTAAALAKFYAMLACGGALNGRTFFKADTLTWMSTTLVQGDDRVLLTDTAFSAGFMRDPLSPDGKKLRAIFGPSPSAFGHPGAGGTHAFADPGHRIAFAYVMNQMEPGVLPGPKSLRLVEAIYG